MNHAVTRTLTVPSWYKLEQIRLMIRLVKKQKQKIKNKTKCFLSKLIKPLLSSLSYIVHDLQVDISPSVSSVSSTFLFFNFVYNQVN